MATHPPRDYVAHAASKAAVEGLVRALAVELAPEVLVNGIAPGAVLVPEGTPAEDAARWARKSPLGRSASPKTSREPSSSSAGRPTHGQVIAVDGGQGLV